METIISKFKALRLKNCAENIVDVIAQAQEKNMSPLQTIEHLLDLELESHRETLELFVADQEPVELLVVCPTDEGAVFDGPFAVAHGMPAL